MFADQSSCTAKKKHGWLVYLQNMTHNDRHSISCIDVPLMPVTVESVIYFTQAKVLTFLVFVLAHSLELYVFKYVIVCSSILLIT